MKDIFLIGSLVFLSACATRAPSSVSQNQIDDQIRIAAEKIERVQSELYQAGAMNKNREKPQISVVDDLQRMNVAWRGDAEQLLNKLAIDRKLAFSTIGIRQPLPVSVNVKNMPFVDVLEHIRLQVGYRADVKQYDDMLVIQFNAPQL